MNAVIADVDEIIGKSVLVDVDGVYDVDVEQVGEWIVLRAAICERSEMDPWDALSHNSTLVVGALSAADGLVILRHTVAKSASDVVPALMRALAAEASRLRALLTRRQVRAAVSIFSNFRD
jgi:hypothetical protein